MPAAEYKAYAEALRKASLLAQQALSELWERLDKSKPEECRDVLIAFVPGIVYKYGSMAALAAAEYYEGEREAAGGDAGYQATLSEGVPYEQIEASIRYAAGHLFGEEGEGGTQPGADRSLFGG